VPQISTMMLSTMAPLCLAVASMKRLITPGCGFLFESGQSDGLCLR